MASVTASKKADPIETLLFGCDDIARPRLSGFVTFANGCFGSNSVRLSERPSNGNHIIMRNWSASRTVVHSSAFAYAMTYNIAAALLTCFLRRLLPRPRS